MASTARWHRIEQRWGRTITDVATMLSFVLVVIAIWYATSIVVTALRLHDHQVLAGEQRIYGRIEQAVQEIGDACQLHE